MRLRPGQRRSARKRRAALLAAALAPLVISFPGSNAVGHSRPSQATREVAVCPTDRVLIVPADVAVGDSSRRLPVGGDEVRGSRVDPLYGRIADDLIDRMTGQIGMAEPVKAICWNHEDWQALSAAFADAGLETLKYRSGWAPKDQGVINLSDNVCSQLDRIAYNHERLELLMTGNAVGTLAHEAVHVAGIDDEGITDCYAMQLTAATASALGAERENADLLQVKYFEFNRQHKSGTEYDSPDCYDGGPLDLNPESPQWP
jgi:hypothetical protein